MSAPRLPRRLARSNSRRGLHAAALTTLGLLQACGGGSASSGSTSSSSSTSTRSVALATSEAVAASASVVTLTKLSETRVSRTVYDYVFKVTVTNGSVAQSGIVAKLTGAGTGTTIVDGSVAVGDLAAGASATPSDTITLRHDRTYTFSESALAWSVTGTPVQVVTFDPSLCTAQTGAPYGQTVGITGTNMMVTSADVNASAAGCRVLARGGSAADAAVAVQAVLGVVEPFASGLAGGSVVTYYDAASKKVRTYDGLSSSPANIGASTTTSIYQMAVDDDLKCRSGYSIGSSLSAQQGNTNISGRATGVPGTVRVLGLVQGNHGRVAWNTLWDEAIGFAENGFPMTKYMYSTLYNDGTDYDDETGEALNAGGVKAWWNSARDRWGAVRCSYTDIQARYCSTSEKPKAVGTTLYNTDLAATMRTVRDGGADAFYNSSGSIVTAILARFKADKYKSDGTTNNCYSLLPSTYNADGTTSATITPARIPSLMAASDFSAYAAVERKPLSGTRFGMTIYTQPAPLFGGLVTLYSLGLLERAGLSGQTWASDGFYYRAIEASRLANADRRNIVGDPAYSNVNTRVAALLDSAYLDKRAALITGTAISSVSAGTTSDGIPAFASTDPSSYNPLAGLGGKAAAKSETRLASAARKAAATRLARASQADHDEDFNTTSNIAIVDGYGNALSMTTTINTHWGAHIEAAGMMLNNAMSNFSASSPGNDVNGYAANKRPRSSISPAIAFDSQGRVRLVWGSAGGGPIPDYIVKTFLGNVVYGMDIQAAINADNWSGQVSSSSLGNLESGSTAAGRVSTMRSSYGYSSSTLSATGLVSGLSGIAVTYDINGLPVYHGGADYRRNGGANGY